MNRHTPSLRLGLLGWLMHVANASRAQGDDWYSLKNELLARYGVADGYDTQRIEATCHDCLGHGCRRCSNGVHHITRTMLNRWTLQGYHFHTLGRTKLTEDELEVLRAANPLHTHYTTHVQHGPGINEKASREAFLWLVLLIKGPLAMLRQMTKMSYCYPNAWPLLNLNRLVFDVRCFWVQNTRLFPHRFKVWLENRFYSWAIRQLTRLIYRPENYWYAAHCAHHAASPQAPAARTDIPF